MNNNIPEYIIIRELEVRASLEHRTTSDYKRRFFSQQKH